MFDTARATEDYHDVQDNASSVYYDPDSLQDTLPRLGTPGTPEFFASLLEYIRATAPDIPLDPVIFQSIILCIMAGNRHVLLRAKEEDISIVQSLASLILTNVFGYPTHKHRIAPSSNASPSSFVPSIFFSNSQGSSSTRLESPFRLRARRSRSYPVPEGHRLSASEPPAPSDPPVIHRRERTDSRTKPPLRPQLHATGTRSDPSPLLGHESPRTPRPPDDARIPTALVLSGLEHSSVPCHRALLRTLLENRVSLDGVSDGARPSVWLLPEDFILVYVCPFDPRERPDIHKSLLDKFSLSVAVALHPSTRQAYATYLATHLSSTTQLSSLPSTPAQSTAPSPVIPRDFVRQLCSLSTPARVNIHASLRLYIADLIGAARHHHELDGTLLGLRCVQDAEALVRAHRVLGAGDAGLSLLERAAALPSRSATDSMLSLPNSHGAPVGVHWNWTSRVSPSPPQPETAALHVKDTVWLPAGPQEKWDVSEVDVAKVVPRVISHRLRVRDGPEDEMVAGVLFMATAPRVPVGTESKGGVWRRRRVH
ncbi:hypothetical protein BC834DRAFT_866979 [Gloeopeniophorella convolvens]|nr:hypothetical protein BC834DRAFT_866979 [Gloeopeniophorella convolvens]